MATTLLIAVVMATAAAWWPRGSCRLSVMAALSGRPSRPRPVHRSLVLAALVVCGVGAIAAARPTSDHVRPLVLIVGLLAVVVGVVFVSPAAVRAGGAGPPAALRPRLAAATGARRPGRPPRAAITLGLGISVAVVAIAGANEYRSDEGNLGPAAAHPVRRPRRGTVKPDPTASERSRLDARAATVAAAIGSARSFRSTAMNPGDVDRSERGRTHHGRRPEGRRHHEVLGVPYVATPDVLAHYGIDRDDRSATDLLTVHGRGRARELLEPAGHERAGGEVQHVDLPRYSGAPHR